MRLKGPSGEGALTDASRCGLCRALRSHALLVCSAYLIAMTIESGPTRCSARVLVKPASSIHSMHSEAV